MIATLPMYDYPEVQQATNAWWAGIARHAGVDFPLSRPADYLAPWGHADLAFSQTCGYPFTHHFKGQLGLVGTPHYAVEGCDGFQYCSFVLARDVRAIADYRGGLAAVNNPDSMSGMLALQSFFVAYALEGRFFSRANLSGGHILSLEMLQRGDADVCAIDAVCMGFVRQHRPALLRGLHILGKTTLVPGLPYVTRAANVSRWQEAVAAAVADPALADVRTTLMINGFTVTSLQDYDAILTLEASVAKRGGLVLL